MLEQVTFVKDLTQLAEEGELEPAHGRKREVFGILEVLARKRRRSVLLVGFPGVGKRHIVGGIAVAGARQETEGVLENFRLIQLDFGVLASGAADTEERLHRLVKYLRTNRDVITFIDDLRLVFEDGLSETGVADYQKTLRSVLARGSIAAICATTPLYFETMQSRDPSALKEFEVLHIDPMTAAATEEVLSNLRPGFEAFYQLEISDDALRAAITLSEQHMPEQFLPGKAVDILDQACSRYRFKKAARNADAKLVDDETWVKTGQRVQGHDVRRVIERMAQIPMKKLEALSSWRAYEEAFRGRVFGQPVAIDAVISTLRQLSEGLPDHHRPKCTFLFVGPRGVGMKLLARHLAGLLYGSEDKFHVFDCRNDFTTEIMEWFGAQRDSGPKSGPSGMSAQMVVPRAVIYIDGIEDAGEDTYESLTSLLEGAPARSGSGPALNLKQCTLVLSLHISTDDWPTGTGAEETLYRHIGIRQQLPSPLANLVDKLVPFFPLEIDAQRSIVREGLKTLRDRLRDQNVHVKMGNSAYDLIVREAYSDQAGASRILPMFEEIISKKLLEKAGRGAPDEGLVVHIRARDGKILFQKNAGPSGTQPTRGDGPE